MKLNFEAYIHHIYVKLQNIVTIWFYTDFNLLVAFKNYCMYIMKETTQVALI